MSRVTRSAHLQVTVDDSALAEHLGRVKQAQEAWGSLGAAASAFGMTDWSKATAAFNALGEAAKSLSADKIGAMADAFVRMGGQRDELASIATSIGGLDTGIRAAAAPAAQLAEALERIGKAAPNLQRVQVAMTQVNNTLNQNRLTQIQANIMAQINASNTATTNIVNNAAQATQATTAFGNATAAAHKKAEKQTMSAQMAFRTLAVTMFIVSHWVKYIDEQMREGAQALDLENVMRRNQEGFARIMQDTREATRGMVSDLQILKSAALMSSFKIPIEDMAKNMELITKLAVRTGQSQEYLFDSFARGVARLSPAILDNLGLQIKLEEAYERHAAASGIATGSMDAQAKKLAVLNEVIRQASELTAEVDPAASLTARMDKLAADWDNLWNRFWGGIVKGMSFLTASSAQMAGIVADNLAIYVKEMKEVGKSAVEIDKVIVATDALQQKWIELKINMATQREIMQSGAITEGQVEAARERVMLSFIEAGLIKDMRKATVEQVDIEAKAQKERERVLRMYPTLISRVRDAQKGFFDTFTTFSENLAEGTYIQRDERRMGEQLKTMAEAGSLIQNLEAGYARINTVREEGKKFTSEDTALQKAYQGLLEQEVRKVEQSIDLLRRKAEQGDLAARWYLASFDTAKALTGIEERSLKLAEERVKKSKEENALLLHQLGIIEDEAKIALASLEGRSPALQAQVDAEEELARIRTKYNELLDKSAVKTSGMESVTNEDIKKQQVLLLKAVERAKAAKEYAELEQWALKFMDDQSFKSKETLQIERELIWAGRTRAQMEQAIVASKLLIQGMLDTQLEREREILALKKEGTVQSMAQAAMLGFQQGVAQAVLTAKIEELKKWAESMSRIPTRGGGPRDTEKKVKEKIEEERIDYEVRMTEHGLMVQRKAYIDHYRYLQGVHKLVHSEMTEESMDLFGARRLKDLQDAQQGLYGIRTQLELGREEIERLNEQYDKMLKEEATKAELDAVLALRDAWRDATAEVELHVAAMDRLTLGMQQYAQATEWAFKHSQDLLGEDVIQSMGDLARNVEDLASVMDKAMAGQAGAYELAGAGLNIVRSFTNEYIKDLRKRAAVEMLMNAAMAWAAFPNVPRMIAHGTAATMFGLVAGGAVRLPGAARGDDKEQSKRSSSPLHIHLYSEMAMTDAERGALVDRAVAQARAEGRI